ncbi:transcription antitermination factor NusB [Psychromonas sp. Urea-02u-13]|uniref:transcription antitermination factor NusB n=1 Tax=Psychromonas sp. Urea-02u-13 TaxID=2058326 RepID=UPI000C349496|nr:transcription antitermination factor NusB [Psychromonas sp. Urea-02u-13]PKG37268.1 transcription antitermination factor NusB [Psychromonas sp. Urea-02u-13]
MKPAERRRARQFAVQAVYQWQITGATFGQIIDQFTVDQDLSKTDVPYFKELLSGVINHIETLDEKLSPYLSRKINDVDMVDIAILRLAMFELSFRTDVPHKVVLNEAIELAKDFATDESYKFVNGVLDKALRSLKLRDA